jgi:hypothetical protein
VNGGIELRLSPTAVADPSLEALPARKGSRPRMTQALPHIQLDQWPPAGILGELLARAARLPDVLVRQSRMAAPDCAALCLADECVRGTTDAFIDLPEFCHLHPEPEGSIHLTLPPGARAAVMESGWGESHLAAPTGSISPYLVVVYAPRDAGELAAVLSIVEISWKFARGQY